MMKNEKEFVLTHTPRQIAEKMTLGDIRHLLFWADERFTNPDCDIWGPSSPSEIVDEITSVEDCRRAIEVWYDDTPKDERPDPEDLCYVYHLQAAEYIKMSEED